MKHTIYIRKEFKEIISKENQSHGTIVSLDIRKEINSDENVKKWQFCIQQNIQLRRISLILITVLKFKNNSSNIFLIMTIERKCINIVFYIY